MPIVQPQARRRVCLAAILMASAFLLASCAGYIPQGGEEVGKAHYQRHLAFRAQNQLDKAALELELAIKADPQMYNAYYQLGLIYQSQGQAEKARVTWERGLAEARSGPDRNDYPRVKAQAEMESALASLDPLPPLMPPTPAYNPPPRPAAKTKVKSKAPARGVKIPSGSVTGAYAVLVSSNLAKSSAVADQKRLASHGYPASLSTHKDKKGKTWHRVWAGCCSGHDKAKALAATLKKKGLARSPEVLKK
jgi:tetratricopeptide (TPR) repeat protein